MTIFTKEKLTAITAVAKNFGIEPLAMKPGIYLDGMTKIIINSNYESDMFKGMPQVGIFDNTTGINETPTSTTMADKIRRAIEDAFKAPPVKEKFQPKVEHDSAKQGQSYTAPKPPQGIKPFDATINQNDPKEDAKKIMQDIKDDESKTKKAQDVSPPAPKPPEPEQAKQIVKNCSVCGFALEPKRAMECFETDPQAPAFICEGCAERKPEPIKPEVMPRESKTPGAVIPAKVAVSKGLRIKNIAQRFAEIGKIKIGRKGEKETASGYKLPEKFDHFEVVTPQRDANGQFVPDEVMSRLGGAPKELKVMLLFDDESLNFPTSYREYKGGKCMCHGDGETAFDYRIGATKSCNTDTCTTFKDKKCKLNGILSVILLDSPRIGGVYVLRTTSFNSVTSLMNSMMLIKTITGGILAMIPLTLTLTPKIVTPKGAEKAHMIYFVNLEYHGMNLLEKVLEVSKHRLAMHSEIQKLESQARQLQAAPESEEEIKDVEREFYPEVAK